MHSSALTPHSQYPSTRRIRLPVSLAGAPGIYKLVHLASLGTAYIHIQTIVSSVQSSTHVILLVLRHKHPQTAVLAAMTTRILARQITTARKRRRCVQMHIVSVSTFRTHYTLNIPPLEA